MKILIADANIKKMLEAQECLKHFGTCEVVSNGKIAFDMIRQSLADKTPYDLIFTNIDMPEVTGLTLVRLVRAYEEAFELRKKTKFILVTEYHKNRSWIGRDKNIVIIEPLSQQVLFKEVLKIDYEMKMNEY